MVYIKAFFFLNVCGFIWRQPTKFEEIFGTFDTLRVSKSNILTSFIKDGVDHIQTHLVITLRPSIWYLGQFLHFYKMKI